jgi:hypothetical protein
MSAALTRRSIPAILAVLALATLLVAAFTVTQLGGPGEIALGEHARGGPSADDNPEKEEQSEQAEKKRQAFEKAVAAGKAGKEQPIALAAAAGWAGEQLMDAAADDWEPAVAADPLNPWVYILSTRYGSTKPCPGNCPDPYIAIEISSNGGASFGAGKPLCACKGGGQFDPIIEVVRNTGAVYSVYMNGFNVVFVKSTNHGSTFSAPVKVYGNVSWNDKPVLAVSDDGKDVYVAFNGPTGGDPWLAQSHDSGSTWTQTKLVDSNRYDFAFDADVAGDGTVYIGESSILYGGGGNKGTTPSGTIDEHLFVSTNKGASFTDRLVAQVQPGLACTAAGCTPDYYIGQHALSADTSGNLVFLYDGATTAGGLQAIYARKSTDKGATWSAPSTLSAGGTQAVEPAVESTGNGDVRAWYFQTTGTDVDTWNVYYRRSADGGSTWTAAVDISDATSGAAYKSAAGFREPYGDYGEMAITSAGKTFAIWGEGDSYTGPGGVWFNREP